MDNIYQGATKIKIKSILSVNFKDGIKYKKYVDKIPNQESWILITDYNGMRYTYDSSKKSKHITKEKIVKVDSEYYIDFYEYYNKGYKNKHILFIIPGDLSLAKDVLGDISNIHYKNIMMLYEYYDKLNNPYEVNFRFGEFIANHTNNFKYKEKDLVNIMKHMLDDYLKDREKKYKISVYKGETKDKIIDLCKEKYQNKLEEKVDWDNVFKLFYDKYGAGGYDKCFLINYTM